ncbi:hypothetical protein [Halomonas heilongjiangensis]|uniref:hypothetical protein n=1 Tax=Halomonas heilongjiangensis TaxID=1387883 RepID=UPI0011AF37E2|nr:hypothetical protein [Halomonas heilongjiangensis]
MLSEGDRLELIAQAARYCKRVRDMGMPRSCYAKAIREPIFFLWEKKARMNKYALSRFRSNAAKNIPNNGGGLIYDHAIPFRYTLERILNLESIDAESVRVCLAQYLVTCTLTRMENSLLNKSGLAYRMPEDWDGVDPLCRYKVVGIEVYEQNLTPKII